MREALEKEEAEYCADCSRRKHAYARGKAVFPYDRLLRASIARFKYRGAPGVRRFLRGGAGETLRGSFCFPGSRTPGPGSAHKSRMRKRGFNQAELTARKVEKHWEFRWRRGFF